MTTSRRHAMAGLAACAAAAAGGRGAALGAEGAPLSAPTPKLRPATRPTPPFSSDARNAVIFDLASDVALYEKSADAPIPPASMTKLMTFLVVVEALEAGVLRGDDRAVVSRRAFRRPGSTMFLALDDRPTIDQLLAGLIILSGNDAAVALAEATAGSTAAFVARMNAAAARLGLQSSRFSNPVGYTEPGHHMSVRDLAALSRHLIQRHPTRFDVFARTHFAWAGVRQQNRNPLLFANLSDIRVAADGLKTGYTAAAGYCAAVSAARREKGGVRRVVAVLAGLPTEAARARASERAIRWAFRQRV